ncbi:hypothetical protein Clacol_006191 [Clathrus columnatus]|uniref:Polysaccharide lyase family 8 protein n=1 Tax=Clathrus columnatus TaxID=1419009 RepID=A0AAV5AGY3_9AGAM|nr:hypothetical protein Clacol_006191 [Clathrus columnatus]
MRTTLWPSILFLSECLLLGTATVRSASLTFPSNENVPATKSLISGQLATSTPIPVPSDPDVATLLSRRISYTISAETGSSNLQSWLSSIGPNGQWPSSQIDYTAGCDAQQANWPAEEHWTRITALAAAWHGGWSKAPKSMVQNETVRAQIGLAVDWWFSNDFTNINCLDNGGSSSCPCGTPGLWNINWYSNMVDIPKAVGQSCILLSPSLTPTQLSNCTNITGRSYAVFHRADKPDYLGGSNTLDLAYVGISEALVSAAGNVNGDTTGNSTLIEEAYGYVHAEVVVQVGIMKDGIQQDGGFSQHEGIIYTGNYGKEYINDVLELEIEAGGTRFAATGDSKSAFLGLMDGSQWMIYENTVTGVLHWDFSVVGRMISFAVSDDQVTENLKINTTDIQVLGLLWNSSDLVSVFNGLSTSTGTANVGNLLGNRMFWNNDYMVQRGTNYTTTLRLYSTRTHNTECLNSQNPFGFHLADGTTYTYVDGNEYEDIAASWDWNLIPGTTVDYNATLLECSTTGVVGLDPFVGGVSTGSIGMSVMDDIEHVNVIVLNSTTSSPVFSVLDQRKRSGAILHDLQEATDDNGNFTNPHTLFHDSIGYLFSPSVEVLSVSTGNQTGSWQSLGISKHAPETVDLFAAWVYHDPNNLNKPISYSVFPGRANAEQFVIDALETPLITLVETTDITAVQDIRNGVTMIAFWQDDGGEVFVPPSLLGTFGGMTVTSPDALVLIMEENGWIMTVADPTQTLDEITLTVTMDTFWIPDGWGSEATKTFTINFPANPMAGSSIPISLI